MCPSAYDKAAQGIPQDQRSQFVADCIHTIAEEHDLNRVLPDRGATRAPGTAILKSKSAKPEDTAYKPDVSITGEAQ